MYAVVFFLPTGGEAQARTSSGSRYIVYNEAIK